MAATFSIEVKMLEARVLRSRCNVKNHESSNFAETFSMVSLMIISLFWDVKAHPLFVCLLLSVIHCKFFPHIIVSYQGLQLDKLRNMSVSLIQYTTTKAQPATLA